MPSYSYAIILKYNSLSIPVTCGLAKYVPGQNRYTCPGHLYVTDSM